MNKIDFSKALKEFKEKLKFPKSKSIKLPKTKYFIYDTNKWNNINHLGLSCEIVEHNKQYAFVKFEFDTIINLQDETRWYEVRDLINAQYHWKYPVYCFQRNEEIEEAKTKFCNGHITFGAILNVFIRTKTLTVNYPNISDAQWDLSKTYIPNWSCVWNKRSNIGRKCKIMAKDFRIACVKFEDDENWDVLKVSNWYRLEDLIMQ